mgnify:CR=1 FL=1
MNKEQLLEFLLILKTQIEYNQLATAHSLIRNAIADIEAHDHASTVIRCES